MTVPLIRYEEKSLSAAKLAVIDQANDILLEYRARGFTLTLRQLYYQFVARDLLANRQAEYKRLGEIISDARLAGLLDWELIIDRTRNLVSLPHWTSPRDIALAAASSYRLDKWSTQLYRPEVWIEKDAAIGVIEQVCQRNDIPYFSCRGYTSQSEMWAAGQRLARYEENGQLALVLHLGDHDPSGIQMSEDIVKRLELFSGYEVEFKRLALNMDQVDLYGPPPNPAKLTDSRAQSYIARFGDESWELDALNPTVLEDLIQDAIDAVRDEDLWEEEVNREETDRERLRALARHWDDLAPQLDKYVGNGGA